MDTLLRDRDPLITFYAFLKEHWIYLRTTALVRLRTAASRCDNRVESAQAIIWKMLTVSEKTRRTLTPTELLPLVTSGTKFKDGVMLQSRDVKSDVSHQPERTAA